MKAKKKNLKDRRKYKRKRGKKLKRKRMKVLPPPKNAE